MFLWRQDVCGILIQGLHVKRRQYVEKKVLIWDFSSGNLTLQHQYILTECWCHKKTTFLTHFENLNYCFHVNNLMVRKINEFLNLLIMGMLEISRNKFQLKFLKWKLQKSFNRNDTSRKFIKIFEKTKSVRCKWEMWTFRLNNNIF